METVQEREMQGRQAWPFDMMSSFDAGSNGSGCFLFEWDPQFGCYGLGAGLAGVLGDANVHGHELFPLYTESPVSSEASTAAAGLPAAQEAMAMPEELDDLLLNFWDANSSGGVGEQVAFSSSCILHEKSTTTTSFLDDEPLSSIFPEGPIIEGKLLPLPPTEPFCSSSSDCLVGPYVSDFGFGGDPKQAPTTPRGARLKRSTPEGAETRCSQSSKRKKASAGVLYPFTVVKPDGLDGGATLADINARILMRPARPVRHPVGEFACAPRVSAGKPGLSGKTVASFTRLHTPGRGTITIIRTRG